MQVRRILLIEGLFNLTVMLCKLLAGLLTQSAAVMADALHSLGDIANNGIAWMAVKVSESPPDKEHPYGHQKFEQLAVFFLASLMTVVAFEVLLHAIRRFGQPVEQSMLGMVLLLLSLGMNILISVWEKYWADKLDSAILKADASHTFSDALTTLVVIVGWQLAYYGFYWIDTLFAVVISGIIFLLSFKLFQRAIPILVDQRHLDEGQVKAAITVLKEVDDVTRVRSRSDGKHVIVDLTVTVASHASTEQSHRIADAIEHLLAEQFGTSDVTVHIEPVDNSTDR